MSVLAKSRGVDRLSAVKPEKQAAGVEVGGGLLSSPSLPRRRPKLAIAGIGVLALSALAGAVTISRGTEQRTAIVAAKDIGAGEVITSAHLRVVRIARDTELRSLPANAAQQLLDGVAAVPISAGSAILPDQINGADDTTRIVTEAVVWRIWASTPGSGSRRAVTLAVPEAAAVDVGGAAARNAIRLLVVPNGEATQPIGWPRALDLAPAPTPSPAANPPEEQTESGGQP
jgi:hypothetical protein